MVLHFHGFLVSFASVRPHPYVTRPLPSGVSSLWSLFNMFIVYGVYKFLPLFETNHSFDQFANIDLSPLSTTHHPLALLMMDNFLIMVFKEMMILEREVASVELIYVFFTLVYLSAYLCKIFSCSINMRLLVFTCFLNGSIWGTFISYVVSCYSN